MNIDFVIYLLSIQFNYGSPAQVKSKFMNVKNVLRMCCEGEHSEGDKMWRDLNIGEMENNLIVIDM